MSKYVSVKCPHCNETMYANSSDEKCSCSNCGKDFIIKENLDETESGIETDKQKQKSATKNSTKKNTASTKKQQNGNTTVEAFYTKTWFVVLMLVVFFPVGIFLMWKYEKFSKVARIIISAVFGLIIISSFFTGNKSSTSTGKEKSVSEVTYDSIKQELGISKELKNGFSSMSNYVYYLGNYRFQIPKYLNQKDNAFGVSEGDDKIAGLTIVKSHDSEDKVTFQILDKETKQGKMFEALKSVYGDIEILNYQTLKNNAVNGYLYKFIDTNRETYYEQFVFGDEKANDWYYLNFQETVDMKYEYNEDFISICKSVDKVKDIKVSSSASSYSTKNYKTVVSDLESQGFKNIVTKPKYDLILGWLTSDEELDSVSINGNASFAEGDVFKENAEVIVTYHTFPSNETIDEKNDKMIGTYIGYGGSAISIYPENAIYYNRNNGKYYDDINWSINNDKLILDFVNENYKVYTDYSFSSQDTYTFTSTNEKWLTQVFRKVNSTDKKYSKEQYDKMLTALSIIKNKNYEDLISEMKRDGYSNITIDPIYDVYFGVVTKDGDIEKISINGETSFDSYLDYPTDAEIKITYHTSYENDPDKGGDGASYEDSNVDDNGDIVTGWQKEGNDWYYYNNRGRKEKSKFIEDYYVGEDGKMVTNTTMTIKRKNYRFDASGKYTEIPDLELVGGINATTTKSDYFATYIKGVVRNNTSKTYKYVQITFKLYDSSGNVVGTAMANENNIGAGETWKFEAMALDDFSRYKLDDITGW